ncbi:acylphosphatase-1-like isoform X1 [Oratosquilla oratoria]|uniref:acylphosphatase-1-like isoform X1 n=1 Tax=Oratosquilla oratoria TaxID=337810 RepID=UPI003F771073
MAKLIAVDFEVFGRVQGVFFRKKPSCNHLTYHPLEHNTLPYVFISPQHEPKYLITQEPDHHHIIFAKKDWLRNTGSPSSRITKAEFRNEKEIEAVSFSHFNIKH